MSHFESGLVDARAKIELRLLRAQSVARVASGTDCAKFHGWRQRPVGVGGFVDCLQKSNPFHPAAFSDAIISNGRANGFDFVRWGSPREPPSSALTGFGR